MTAKAEEILWRCREALIEAAGMLNPDEYRSLMEQIENDIDDRFDAMGADLAREES